MTSRISMALFGSSLVSAYWNGAATYYRGIVRALHEHGFDVTFYEPDAFGRQQHRDMEDPPWASVKVYEATQDGVQGALEHARGANILCKASGVGVFDELLEAELPRLRNGANTILFWDVDAPATLQRLRENPHDPFHGQVSRYDAILTYGGGDEVVRDYMSRGARECVPIYNALDSSTHHPVPPDPRFAGTLGFLGNRLPDRESRVREFFLDAAARLPEEHFILGGNGWGEQIALPPNVRHVGHVYTRDHNAFNCTPRAVININRASMAKTGFSPPTRIFEAAGAAACLLCDAWQGIEQFLEPGREVLCVQSGQAVAETLRALSEERAREIGRAARRRILREHTYDHRARELQRLLGMQLDGARRAASAREHASV